VRPPPSLCSIVSAALVLAFGPRFSLGEHQESGLVEPDGVWLWRVRHGSVPGCHRSAAPTAGRRRRRKPGGRKTCPVPRRLVRLTGYSGPRPRFRPDGLAAIFVASAGAARDLVAEAEWNPPACFAGQTDSRSALGA
jgi:hypothetical protein